MQRVRNMLTVHVLHVLSVLILALLTPIFVRVAIGERMVLRRGYHNAQNVVSANISIIPAQPPRQHAKTVRWVSISRHRAGQHAHCAKKAHMRV